MKVGLVSSSISSSAGGIAPVIYEHYMGLNAISSCDAFIHSLHDKALDPTLSNWSIASERVFLSHILGPRSFSFSRELVSNLLFNELDIVHSHGLWTYPSLAVTKWKSTTGRSYVVSPHGMLDPWALSQSRVKKTVALSVFQRRHLEEASCIHALCESEYRCIRSFGLSNPVAVIPNGMKVLTEPESFEYPTWYSKCKGKKVLLFLGRIHKKKGLENLILAWSQVTRLSSEAGKNWVLVIAGWDDGCHLRDLVGLVESLSVSDSVHFVGPQFGKEKDSSYQFADGFVLPSLSEGLPMSVLEAWSHSVPVLMTEKCNLSESFVRDAAVEISIDPEEMARDILLFFNKKSLDRKRIGANGYQHLSDKYCWIDICRRMSKVYSWLFGEADIPDFVELR